MCDPAWDSFYFLMCLLSFCRGSQLMMSLVLLNSVHTGKTKGQRYIHIPDLPSSLGRHGGQAPGSGAGHTVSISREGQTSWCLPGKESNSEPKVWVPLEECGISIIVKVGGKEHGASSVQGSPVLDGFQRACSLLLCLGFGGSFSSSDL